MKDESLLVELGRQSPDVSAELLEETRQFLAAIDGAATANREEAVPAEMMQMFSDEQWLELIFEFQPGTTLFTSKHDIASLHQGWMETGDISVSEAGELNSWLIFADAEGLIVKLLLPEEFKALEMAANGDSFSAMGAAVWPDLTEEQARHEMTEMLLVWLNDGLIIDAGVPLPEDAEFEGE